MSDRSRIVFLCLGKGRSGGEEYLVRLLAGASATLRSRCVVVFVFDLCFQHYQPRLHAMGLECELVRGGPWAQVWKVAGIIRRSHPCVVHVNGVCDRAAKFFWLKALFPAVRFCMTNHYTPDPDSDGKRLRALRKISRSLRTAPLFGFADPLIFVSQHQVGLMARNRYFRAARPLVITNGVELPDVRVQFIPVVGLVCGNYPVKNFPFAMRVMDRVLQSGFDFRIKHYGDNGEPLARDLSPENVSRFSAMGYVNDKVAIYGSMGLLFSPGHQEACPYNVIEAMSYGLPVLLPDVALYHELVGKDGGQAALYFEKDNLDDAARQLTRLLTDSELRARLGEAARELVEERYAITTTNRRTWEAILGEHFSAGLLASP